MVASIDFQPYIQSLCRHYAEWWSLYTLTDIEEKKAASRNKTRRIAPFDFGLMMQSVNNKAPETSKQEKPEKPERQPVLKGLRDSLTEAKHVLLIGRPGSGKSTALARLLLEEAQQSQKNNEEPTRIPVLIELRYYQTSVIDLIRGFFRRHDLLLETHDVETLLSENQLLLLIDGLNELSSKEAARQDLAKLRDYRNVPMIFTTRDLSLGGDFGIEKQWEMLPLTETQMQAFIRSYLSLEQADDLWRQLKDRTRKFAETPLLLWMLCELFEAGEEIPHNLGEVFRIFTRTYENSSIRKHEVAALKGDVQPLSDRRLWFPALKHLAYTMMQGETPVDARTVISRAEAEREFKALFRDEPYPAKTARDCLDDLLNYHLLQIKTNDEIEFRHQLIQEYYAAEWLLERIPELSDEQLQYYFLNYLKWTEAIGLMLGLVEQEAQALQVVELALGIDLRLGARLAGEVQQDWQERAVSSVIEEARQQQVSSTHEMQLLGNTHSDYAASILIAKFTDEEEQDLLLESAFALRELGSRSPVQQLLLVLQNGKPFICQVTLFVLGKLGDEKIIPDLQKALSHPDDNVREQAAGALGELGNDIVVPDLLNALKDESYKVCEKSVEALGNLRNELAIPELLKIALEDQTIHLPWMATEALKKIHQEKATEELLRALKDKNYKIRQRAAEALGKVGSETAIDGLIEALEDGHIVWQVAEALVEIGSKKALPGLLKALECSIPSEQSAFVLGELGDALAVPNLINVLNHWYPQVRERAVEALGKLGDEAAIPRLYELLQDNLRDDLRKEIIVALGKLGDERVRSELVKMLENQAFGSALAWSGQWQLFDALEKIGGQPVIQVLKRAMGAKSAHIRWKAAEVLGNLGNEVAIDSLLTALADEHSTVRWQSAKALGKFDSQHVMSILSPLLKHKDDPNIREAAVQVLGYLEDEAAVTALLDALDDPELSVCYDAGQSLVRLSTSKVKPVVSKALGHPWKGKLLNDGFIYPVQNLQENCQFYNYDITQSDPPPAVNQELGTENRGQTTNIFPNATDVKIFEKVERYYEHPSNTPQN